MTAVGRYSFDTNNFLISINVFILKKYLMGGEFMEKHNCSSDQGGEPYVVNIDRATKLNNNYRTALWTGKHLQLTLMSIRVGGEIGLEVHYNTDQFLRIEQGFGLVKMGKEKNSLTYQKRVGPGFAIFVPAGTWHNLINTGNVPIKLYSIYAPPNHPKGTVQKTKAVADAEEH